MRRKRRSPDLRPNSIPPRTPQLLNNGMVLVAGGYDGGSFFIVGPAELFDPATETWTISGLLNEPRYSPYRQPIT